MMNAKRKIVFGQTAAALVLACTLPASATGTASSEKLAVEADFEESFEEFETLPDFPEADATAVDLAEIDPPIEIEEPEPERTTQRSLGTGIASYYGKRFHGRRTANGERFDMYAMTAAHKTLPFGTMVRVTNPRNGKSVVVRINDRGPFIKGRTIDLSRGAASEVGIIQSGHGRVELDIVS